MNKEQFLCASLHTGLHCEKYGLIIGIYDLAGWCIKYMDGNFAKNATLSCVIPIARPLSDLAKEIEHNGEKFVPIVELAKIADVNVTDSFKCVSVGNHYGVRFKDEDDECVFYEIFAYSTETNSFSFQSIEGEDIINERQIGLAQNQLQCFQKLIEWHFDLMDESEPFITVTEEFNPYK